MNRFSCLCLAICFCSSAVVSASQVIDTWQNHASTHHGTGVTPTYTLGQSFVADQPGITFGFYLAPGQDFDPSFKSEIEMFLFKGENTISTAPLLTRPAFRTDLSRSTLEEPDYVFTLYAADFSAIALERGATYSVSMNTRSTSFLVPLLYVSTQTGPRGYIYQQGNAIMNGLVLTEGDYAFRLTQVPEPSAWAVLLVGWFLITRKPRRIYRC